MQAAILLASYNGEKYIREQIESLLSQTFGDFTLYIHDDGSKDKTLEIIGEYLSKYPDKIKLLDYPPQGGAKNNFLSLMERIDADYYFFCDQDDHWKETKLEEYLKRFDFKPYEEKELLIFSDLSVADEKLGIIAGSFFEYCDIHPELFDWKNILCKGYIPGCVMAANKKLIKKALNFKDKNNIVMHDWWLMYCAYASGGRIEVIPMQSILYRQHSENEIGIKKQNLFGRLLTNIKFLLSGNYFAEKHKYFYPQRAMAGELSKLADIIPERKEFAKEFSEIGKKNKISRIKFYLENFKNTKFKWNLLWI